VQILLFTAGAGEARDITEVAGSTAKQHEQQQAGLRDKGVLNG